MLSFVKRILICLAIITVAAFTGVLFYTKDRTFGNSENEIGNTTGNIYNGGLFREKDDLIYFSNDFAGGSLYSMKQDFTYLTKVSEDKAVYINVDENYIYYVKATDTKENNPKDSLMFNNSGVYRINRNGPKFKVISSQPGANLILKGNDLYVQQYEVEKGLNLYRYEIDGSNPRLMVEGAALPVAVTNEYVYYTDPSQDNGLSTLNLSSYTNNLYSDGSYLYPLFQGDYIYYIDKANKNNLYRMNRDGSEPTLLINEPCSTYNITTSGKYLYYQVNNKKKSYIGRINLETMKSETLKTGSFKQINVTERYVFFKDLDSTNTYVVVADGNAEVNTFSPSISDKE